MGLPHLLAASGSGAGSSAPTPPAGLAGAARSPPAGARGAGPARLRAPPAPRPGPAHPRLRQTRVRPPATPPRAANPQAGAGRSALTLWSLGPCPRLGPLGFTYSRKPRVGPELLCSLCVTLLQTLQRIQWDHALPEPHIFGEREESLWLGEGAPDAEPRAPFLSSSYRTRRYPASLQGGGGADRHGWTRHLGGKTRPRAEPAGGRVGDFQGL